MFSHVEPFAGDPILSLNEDFQKDPRPHKINLSIGIYFDDAGRIPVLESVKRAEAQLLAEGGAKPYLPIEGAANFRSAVQALLFGADHEAHAARGVELVHVARAVGIDPRHQRNDRAQLVDVLPALAEAGDLFDELGGGSTRLSLVLARNGRNLLRARIRKVDHVIAELAVAGDRLDCWLPRPSAVSATGVRYVGPVDAPGLPILIRHIGLFADELERGPVPVAT